ncbi:hypothetical protein B0H19DRAFT_1260107 [Mycena capillaripes]|nr:hypothetical protein B0H19DRAFT_1260107 [Mycena capillaripes]
MVLALALETNLEKELDHLLQMSLLHMVVHHPEIYRVIQIFYLGVSLMKLVQAYIQGHNTLMMLDLKYRKCLYNQLQYKMYRLLFKLLQDHLHLAEEEQEIQSLDTQIYCGVQLESIIVTEVFLVLGKHAPNAVQDEMKQVILKKNPGMTLGLTNKCLTYRHLLLFQINQSTTQITILLHSQQ